MSWGSTYACLLNSVFTYMYLSSYQLSFMQIDFGLLAACFHVRRERKGASYCIVQLYEPMDTFGIPVINEFDCPLLSLTNLFRCVLSYTISQSVSVIHECTPSCTFQRLNTATQVEREVVVSQNLSFQHDFCNNNLYSFDIYCMHSSESFC